MTQQLPNRRRWREDSEVAVDAADESELYGAENRDYGYYDLYEGDCQGAGNDNTVTDGVSADVTSESAVAPDSKDVFYDEYGYYEAYRSGCPGAGSDIGDDDEVGACGFRSGQL